MKAAFDNIDMENLIEDMNGLKISEDLIPTVKQEFENRSIWVGSPNTNY